jgi:glutathione S-transferase-like protein
MVMEPQLTLWGIGTSRTIRAHWALHELDLPYVRRPILARSGETKTPEFTALNPRQKIPLLQDAGLTIGESAAKIFDAGTWPPSGTGRAAGQVARMVLLHRDRTGFDEPLRHAPAWHPSRACAHLWQRA